MRRRPSFTRSDRLGSLMRDEVERIVDYDVRSAIVRHVYITDCVLSGDLGHLRVRYVMKSSDELSDSAQAALDKAAGFVARTLTDSLQLHRTPRIVFSFDCEFVRMRRMKLALDAERVARGEAPLDAGRLEADAALAGGTAEGVDEDGFDDDDDDDDDDDGGFDDDDDGNDGQAGAAQTEGERGQA